MKPLWIIIAAAHIAMASSALGELRVVATVPNLGMLARAIGGETVSVRVLAPPNRDPHYLDARPSMMAALRRADLVVAVGAELEIGWLPAAIRGANNRRVQPGQSGYFEATAHVELLWDDKPADRALGDVHPAGNPHIYLDPERMAQVGYALAERLGVFRPDQAAQFQENANRFAKSVEERIPQWRTRASGCPGVLADHSDADYLLALLNVPMLGHIEPLPGIPPTAQHLYALVQTFRGRDGVIWNMEFRPAHGGDFLSRELGWPVVRLPSQVSDKGDADDYFKMIDKWVDSLVIDDE